MRLIGFTGLKGSGKDTAFDALSLYGFVNVKMAGPLKAMLHALLDYQGVGNRAAVGMIDGPFKEAPSHDLAGRSPRYAMQTLGTEWGRDQMAADFWIQMAEARIRQFNNVVVSDVRFPNEVDMVKRLGGMVYRIDRGIVNSDLHPSEQQILKLKVDGVIENNFATAPEFRDFIVERLL